MKFIKIFEEYSRINPGDIFYYKDIMSNLCRVKVLSIKGGIVELELLTNNKLHRAGHIFNGSVDGLLPINYKDNKVLAY